MFPIKELLDQNTEYMRTWTNIVNASTDPKANLALASVSGHALVANMLIALKYEMEEQTRILHKMQSDLADTKTQTD